jgi:regulator of nucleoside diphosphate kinase
MTQTQHIQGEPGRIQITSADYQRLNSLVDSRLSSRDVDAAEALADELDRAEVVPTERIAGNVVTMNSRVVFEDQQSFERREVQLVYPADSDVERGRISVLAPIGTALLGLAVGQTIEWPLPGRQVKRLRIVEVVYQPEGAGDVHL